MQRKKSIPNRKQPVVILDKETGGQWIYSSTLAAAEALGRSRQWVAQVISNPLHIAHKDIDNLSPHQKYTVRNGKIVERQRGGYSKYDVQKFKIAAWKIIGAGIYKDGSPGVSCPPINFSTFAGLADFLDYKCHKTLRDRVKNLLPGDILDAPAYCRLTGAGYYIQRLVMPEFKDGTFVGTYIEKTPVDLQEKLSKK